MAHAAQVPTGTVAGHYQILAELGSGGMGVVYKAFDSKLERCVALKFLTHTKSDLDERDRALREARAASNLRHKNIAAIYSVEESDNGELFIVMEYHEGTSLHARMRDGPMPYFRTLQIVRDIAEGLSHAHIHNVIHRDIKPSNIIVTNEGTAVIVDFGLARIASSDTLTQTAGFAGTLLYMSPEQLAGNPADERSDIWSLGVIAYQMLTGHFPFPSDSPAATVDAILRSKLDFGGVPPPLRPILERALCKDAATRYQTCTELLRDLEVAEDKLQSIAAAPTEFSYPRRFHSLRKDLRQWSVSRKQRIRIVAAAALVLGLSIGLYEGLKAEDISPAAWESYQRGTELLGLYYQPGKVEEAIKSFESATRTDQKFALAFAKLGEAYWIKYRLDDDPKWIDLATAAAKHAAQLNDQLPAVYVTLGRIHGGTDQHDLAIQEFQRAYELDNSSADALLGLADVYGLIGRKQEAEEHYRRAIAMRPGNWIGPYRLGQYYYSQRRYADAETQFRGVLEIVPDHALAHASLGVSALRLREYATAESELRKAIAISPDYAAYTNLGLVYYQQRRFADAARLMERALLLSDKDHLQWHNLAQAYEWLGQKDKSAEAYQRERLILEEKVRFKPEDASVQAYLGSAYAARHQREKAVPLLEAALALSPDDPGVLTKVGEGYELLGDRAKAVELISKALSKGYPWEELELTPEIQTILRQPSTRAALERASEAQN